MLIFCKGRTEDEEVLILVLIKAEIQTQHKPELQVLPDTYNRLYWDDS